MTVGFRVERVRAQLDVYVEFEGRRTIMVDYVPALDDQAVALLLKKNEEINLADAIAAGEPPTLIG